MLSLNSTFLPALVCGHFIMQNVFTPISNPHCLSPFRVQSNISFETQDNLLIVNPCIPKKEITYFQHTRRQYK